MDPAASGLLPARAAARDGEAKRIGLAYRLSRPDDALRGVSMLERWRAIARRRRGGLVWRLSHARHRPALGHAPVDDHPWGDRRAWRGAAVTAGCEVGMDAIEEGAAVHIGPAATLRTHARHPHHRRDAEQHADDEADGTEPRELLHQIKHAEALQRGEEGHGNIVRGNDDGRLVVRHAVEERDDHPDLAKEGHQRERPRQRLVSHARTAPGANHDV